MLKDLIGLITNFVDRYEKEKTQLFNNHVEPLKNQIHSIHKEYINTFLEARRSLENKEIPIAEVLHFLEQRRHALAAERHLSQTIATELQKANRRIVPPHAWLAFEEFNKSIVKYFISANSVARASWYSDFINFMQVSQAIGDAKFFDHNFFGNDPRVDTIEHINSLIETKLPAALNDVNRNYAALRTALL